LLLHFLLPGLLGFLVLSYPVLLAGYIVALLMGDAAVQKQVLMFGTPALLLIALIPTVDIIKRIRGEKHQCRND